MIELIAAGLSAIASVSTILRNHNQSSCDSELSDHIQAVESRVASLQAALEAERSGPPSGATLARFNELVRRLRSDEYYGSRLEFHPTGYGTWRLVAIKPTILRDPHGEYNRARPAASRELPFG